MSSNLGACDRCHRYKEKCISANDSGSCVLCQSSALPCTRTRARRRRGRPPTAKLLGPNTSIQLWEVESNPAKEDRRLVGTTKQPPSQTDELSCERIPNLQNPFDSSPGIIERFAAKYDLFMIGPTFALHFRIALQNAYSCAPVLLQDIFTITFKAIKNGEHYKSSWQQFNDSKGAASLRKLRTVQISGIQEAAAVIALGQSLAAFELLTNCTSSISILRYSLSLIKPWYRELSSSSSFDPVVVGPIFWDTVSCLVRREIPVIKFWCRDARMIDHSAGLCTTLLPILFDLCVAGNALKGSPRTASQPDTNNVKQVEQTLLAWNAQPISNLPLKFTHQETLAMISQANMYQTAGLLISHRLQHPLGMFDDVAVHYANTILEDFSTFLEFTGPDSTMPYVAFPVTIAAFEVPITLASVWGRITMLAAAPVGTAKLNNIVEFMWKERRKGFAGNMFDLVDSGPEFTVVP